MLLLIYLVLSFLSGALLAWFLFSAAIRYWDGYRAMFTESAATNLSDMFMFVDPQQLFRINVIAIVVMPLFTLIIFRDLLAALVIMGLLVVIPRFIYGVMRNRRLKKFEKQLPDGLVMVSGAMRAGTSLNIALEGLVREQPAPLAQEFELFLREQRLGMDFNASLTHMEERLPIADFHMVLSALRISREVGGNLAEVLESLAETLRRKAMMEGKIESLTAQGRLQGIVMTMLPILLAVVLMQIEPEAMGKLFNTEVGWAVLAVIVVMESMGYVMIRKITSIDV